MPIHFDFGGFDPKSFTNNSGQDKADYTYDPQQSAKKPRKPIGTPVTRVLINILVTVLFGLGYFYIELPALNLQAEEFYVFVFMLCAVFCISAVVTSGFESTSANGYFGFLKKQCTIPAGIALLLVGVIAIGSLTSWVVFRADAYSKLLPMETGDFASEITEVSYNTIPMLDDASAQRLGDRKLGELSDMVSQFEVMNNYTQINYQGSPVRVTSLQYADLIKWFTNRSDGLPAYLIVDMVTQNVEVVRLDEGMKYTTAEHFSRNLYRHLRFNYPTFMFDEPVFEIDEEGTPYWVCSRIVKQIGLFGGTDIEGAVVVNAITGEHEYYEEVPDWVDRVYTADIVLEQYDYYGLYNGGFLNSIFGQRDVTVTTSGYNYLVIDEDVYVYTGITSVTSDQSNIGFILSNQRTKDTTFYSVAGAEEYSAMGSAEGEVQHLGYDATFPLLINIADQPTYFMALKDDAGLVKMYAMVNVQQYQLVATGSTVAEAEEAYRLMLAANNIIGNDEVELEYGDLLSETGIIAEIRSSVVDGNTQYFFRMEGQTTYYQISAGEAPVAVLLDVGDQVFMSYHQTSESEAITALQDITYG
ncbi:CvpA family protein [Bengtsoniella intestinalis]|uniref:CvpA family protein n=1 Tax=Bengtsoniella intestinalis TaxID=3073143 RepID=UPI00391F9AEC